MTEFIVRLWNANKPLTAVGLAMLPLFVASVAAIFLDSRLITGAPAWLKPAKFAISIGIYLLTLAWVFRSITVWPNLMSAMAWVTALAMVVEIVIIDAQAFRGTTSHFNNSTPLDQSLFAMMGLSIGLLWIASAIITAALFVQHFDNRILGAALRYGMLLTVLGSASGGAMVSPRAHQLAEAETTHHLSHTGSHTIGAPDGGPGLPGVGWSTRHGDLRIPHFLGLHGIQALLLLAWVLSNAQVSEARGERLVLLSAASYFALYVLLFVQAMRGEPIVSPSTPTVAALGSWFTLTLAGAFFL